MLKDSSLSEIAVEVHAIAKAKGWWENGERNFGELMMLATTELAEAFEEYRNGRAPTEIYYNAANPTKPEGIPIELADLLIRILDNCVALGINIERAMITKIEYNRTRPYRHGGKLA